MLDFIDPQANYQDIFQLLVNQDQEQIIRLITDLDAIP